MARVWGLSELVHSRSTFASRDRPSFGAWCVIPGGFTAQLLAHAGFDWLCIDMQHGLIGYTEMRAMVQAVRFTGVPVLVRVSANTGGEIMRALDVGADGVIVPMVNSAAEAKAAVAACRYPPLGIRSWGPTGASIGRETFTTEAANRDVVCLVMIETSHRGRERGRDCCCSWSRRRLRGAKRSRAVTRVAADADRSRTRVDRGHHWDCGGVSTARGRRGGRGLRAGRGRGSREVASARLHAVRAPVGLAAPAPGGGRADRLAAGPPAGRRANRVAGRVDSRHPRRETRRRRRPQT